MARNPFACRSPGSRSCPLGGLNAALHHAESAGFDAVLCVPVDVHPLPENLRVLLEGAEAKAFELQHAVGFWPVRYASKLDRHLAAGNLSFRSWIGSAEAIVISDQMLALENVNTPDDLNKLIQ
ncbi:molybdenum cofactor guanylyltransferase [Sphingomonas sp. M1-B02]|uniref:molybdenum cofactor guanylyltransferase n=1 Tax=Sphingomonas sp. M1-B02 TaxID=3114300 RepID=UPI00223FD92D|nr:hypothetical protein [Sphingomonas sp. S6-11]UZK66691.1 hypothetical protein OKW87_02300 [Sphingomonas sp. S6-11]